MILISGTNKCLRHSGDSNLLNVVNKNLLVEPDCRQAVNPNEVGGYNLPAVKQVPRPLGRN